MYLKSLTLRGFKSFASATTLQFEPGITCVVGPNGSGKSNVVDAIAWVMGEQGAKSLRGGKMEDVIFAGTSGRAPLGRAEVALTIDNTDGALPIDYTEVTITRTMFRNGGSEYSINGDTCRLLDVQELLSDSGIGREMHVIVGQGQLDAILQASPEGRRGFIEEAAGVLKHRKRKEKALRKLDAMSANLVRLTDLTAELRRQLKPLGRQAELARRAQVIQANARDAKLRLLADDVVTLSSSLAKEEADEVNLKARRDEVQGAIEAAREREAVLEDAIAVDAPLAARSQETYVALRSIRERFAGLRSVAAEKERHGSTEVVGDSGPDPDELERQAADLSAQGEALQVEIAAAAEVMSAANRRRLAAERAVSEEEARLSSARRARAARRDAIAKLRGELAAAKSRADTRSAEIDRLSQTLKEAHERHAEAVAEHRGHADEVDAGGFDSSDLAAAEAEATRILEATEARLETCRADESALAAREAALGARVEALRLGLDRKDASATLLAAEDLAGVLGATATLVHVTHGYEAALAAALGPLADGVAVADADCATAALGSLGNDEGRASLLVGGAPAPAGGDPWPDLPPGAVYAIDVVTADDRVRGSLVTILERVAIVEDLDSARRLVNDAEVTAVTRHGEVVSRTHAAGGRVESLIEVQGAIDEAAAELLVLADRREHARLGLLDATAERDDARRAKEQALAELREVDAAAAAARARLNGLESAVDAANAEVRRIEHSLAAATSAGETDREGIAELEHRLAAAVAEPEAADPGEGDLPTHKRAVEEARTQEVEGRLRLRTLEERQQAGARRIRELRAAAERQRSARARLAAQRARLERSAAVAADVLRALDVVEPEIESALARAGAARSTLEEQRTARDAELRRLRADVRTWGEEASKLNDSVHRDEMAKAQQRLRIEAAQEKALVEFGVDPTALVAEYGPDQLIEPSAIPAADADEVDAAAQVDPIPFVRSEQEARARKADRELAALGRVNPLALEEFSALQERQAFLTEQLEDLKRGRDDLLGIISDVDERVREVFAEAYADVAEQFEAVFARLFPGGEGRLVLTDPSDMLATGIEVEARPPGKKIKRLSLLSGGERSLTAVAFLVALFKARPSPFYLLDEVEAALDDVNLGRLLDLLEELRETSQLLMITHQKRSMEIADALYGVTMRDGVTSVISQRLREAV
ncbi:MAG: chromosome segregation protein SMC [Actinobacteria bacterium]|nr:chromosome segregation protein SMC [Actinomycetota bacterium]